MWRKSWGPTALVVVLVATVSLVLVGAAPPASGAAITDAQRYGVQALTPARLADTRPGATTADGQGAPGLPVGPGAELQVVVAGRGGVPATGAGAVILNVTVTEPTAAGFLTVWPSAEARPLASSLNFTPGVTVPNAVIAKVGAGGAVSIYNSAGSSHVIVDVTGWFPMGAAFNGLSPARVADTRPGGTTVDGQARTGATIGQEDVLTLQVAGRAGVPFDAGAVVLNVTVTEPSAAGFLTVHPADVGRPLASSLNFSPGQTVANLVIAKLGVGGGVTLYNANGRAHVVVDVAGWFPPGSSFTGLTPARVADTRPGALTVDNLSAPAAPVGSEGVFSFDVTGRGGVPANGVGAVVLNVTVTDPTAPGYLTVWPSGEGRPLASSLNYVPGQTVPNLVVAKVGVDGRVSIYNAAGSSHLVVDLLGWFPGAVRATNDGLGTDDPSLPDQLPMFTAPTAPTSVEVAPAMEAAVVSFSPPASNGGRPITGYAVTCRSGNGGVEGTATGATSPIVVEGLTGNRAYVCAVAAVNVVGSSLSGVSGPVTVPLARTVPSRPYNVSAQVEDRNAIVSFAPSLSDGGSPITQYAATCNSTDEGTTRTGYGFSSPVTVPSLSVGKTYHCRVVASNDVGTSVISVFSGLITVAPSPSAPGNVQVEASGSVARVTFQVPTTRPAGLTYEADCVSPNGGVRQIVPGDTNAIDVPGLTPGRTYRCFAVAVASTGRRGSLPSSTFVADAVVLPLGSPTSFPYEEDVTTVHHRRFAVEVPAGVRLGALYQSTTSTWDTCQAESSRVTVIGPDGVSVAATTCVGGTSDWMSELGTALAGPVVTTEAGWYVVETRGSSYGSIGVFDVQDTGGAITVDGPGVTTEVTPGATVRLSFEGVAGQLVWAISNPVYGDCAMRIEDAAGNTVSYWCFEHGYSAEVVNPLPATGTYFLVLDPADHRYATTTLTLHSTEHSHLD